MNNKALQLDQHRLRMSMVVFTLLALLLVFLSSVSHHQASVTRLDQGFIGPFDNLVVAQHNDSFRARSTNHEKITSPVDDRDSPDWWRVDSTVVWSDLCSITCVVSPGAKYSPLAARFLLPLLRAPPLA